MAQDEILATAKVDGWDQGRTQQAFQTRAQGGDWRTSPQGVRAPYVDQTKPLEDALSTLDPEASYFLNTIATGVQKKNASQLLIEQAAAGETVQSMQSQVKAARASDEALKLAEQSLEISDQEFDDILSQLKGETESRPLMPEMDQEGPSRLEQIIAAGLSLAMPNQAFNIGNAPYAAAGQRQQQRYQVNLQRYGEQMARRADKIELLEGRLRIAEARRREAAENVRRLADDAAKRGDALQSNALSMRSKLYDAKTPEEIDDIMRVMREHFPAVYLPDKSVVDGLKSQLKAAGDGEIEKLKFQKEKEASDREYAVLDDFRSWVGDNYPSGISLGKSEVKVINDERARWAKEHGVPLSKFPVYSERTAPATQNADLSERRYEETVLPMMTISQEYLRLAQEREKRAAAQDNEKPDPSKKAKRQRLQSLTTKLENAKIDTDAIVNTPPPSDSEAAQKQREKLVDAWAKEYAILKMKREAAGGKAPSIQDYFQERFGEKFKMFGKSLVPQSPISGPIGPLKVEPSLPKGLIK